MRDRGQLLLCLLAMLASPLALRAAEGPFRDLSAAESSLLPPRGASEAPLPARYRVLEVELGALADLLAMAPAERSNAALGAPLEITLPLPDGTDQRFRVEDSPILEPALAERFPEIRTFTVRGIDDPTASGRLSLTAMGFHAMVLSTAGTVYIDPYRKWEGAQAISYYQRDARRHPGATFRCEVTGEGEAVETAEDGAAFAVGRRAFAAENEAPSGATLRTYRLALAATGEYSTAVCAPNPVAVACAMSAIVTSMNRVDGIYEREVAVRMVLVANNDLVVYTNGGTDPYTNNNGSTMLTQNQTNLNAVIGSANYDVGHVFSTGGGGVAQLGVPCGSSKARGVTGSSNPTGDGFDVDYVAHEMGHQFGGNHTFNGTTSNCGGGNRSAGAAYEPGSGTTIMAYAGICGAEDLQPHSDDTFHSKSFDEIVAFSASPARVCDVETATGNSAPVVNAGAAFTIPKQTPFTLTGGATDGDGDALTYQWEEFDLGTAAPPNDDTAAVRPIFRSFPPTAFPSRTFPRLADVLGNVATLGESMSTRSRTMTFRLTARDNRTGGGGVNWAATTVTVVGAAGPFLVTQPNTAVTWIGNATETVTWNVAGTDGAPISCAQVAIELSTDGGNSFGVTLAAATANDGSEAVTVPVTPTSLARIRVACVGNIFFDLSNVNFSIVDNPTAPTLASILPATGSEWGGTVVTLTGTGFASGATVDFGGAAGTSVTFNGPTSLTATTPVHLPGAVAVTVTNPDNLTASLVGGFSFFPDLPWSDGFETGDWLRWSSFQP